MDKFLLLCLISLSISTVSFDLEKLREEMLSRHNYLRSQHHTKELVRDSSLEKYALNFTNYLITLDHLEHSPSRLNDDYIGENICAGRYSSTIGTDCVNLWYSEEPNFDYKKNEFDANCGHFTQIVWKNTKELGCGMSCDEKDHCVVSCNYYPSGNFYGQFTSNVFSKDDFNAGVEIEPEREPTEAEKLEQFKEDVTRRHNVYRIQHQAGELERDPLLEKISQEAAEHMLEIDDFYLPTDKYNGDLIGMNLFWVQGQFNGNDIVDNWYKEVDNYDFNNPGYKQDAGGFTQLVWRNSKKIGCGYACKGIECYGICTYYPAGNYDILFAKNVFPKIKN